MFRAMRIPVIAALLALAAASCAPAPAGEAAASETVAIQGVYRAASATARSITGNMSIERGGLMFDRGVILYTRTLEPRRGSDRTAQDGDSYAAIVVGPSDLLVELRRVTEQTLSEGAEGLCGDDEPGYAALVYEERATAVTVVVFAGEEAPSPTATQSRLCGTFEYHAPDGARTSEGVVLW
jgi:hypothetical protein